MKVGPAVVRRAAEDAAAAHNVCVKDILGRAMFKEMVRARCDLVKNLFEAGGGRYKQSDIARALGRHPSTISCLLADTERQEARRRYRREYNKRRVR